MWKIINTLIEKSKTDITETFCHNDMQHTNPTEVSNTFKNYLTNKGPKLADKDQN